LRSAVTDVPPYTVMTSFICGEADLRPKAMLTSAGNSTTMPPITATVQ
jgi:hypothetical protein